MAVLRQHGALSPGPRRLVTISGSTRMAMSTRLAGSTRIFHPTYVRLLCLFVREHGVLSGMCSPVRA